MLLPKDLRDFVDRETWTYAKTMPEWPHEYIVRDRVDESLFVQLVEHIRAHGYAGTLLPAGDHLLTMRTDSSTGRWVRQCKRPRSSTGARRRTATKSAWLRAGCRTKPQDCRGGLTPPASPWCLGLSSPSIVVPEHLSSPALAQ